MEGGGGCCFLGSNVELRHVTFPYILPSGPPLGVPSGLLVVEPLPVMVHGAVRARAAAAAMLLARLPLARVPGAARVHGTRTHPRAGAVPLALRVLPLVSLAFMTLYRTHQPTR